MDAILLRALPVRGPESLVVLNLRSKGEPTVVHSLNGPVSPKTRQRRRWLLSSGVLSSCSEKHYPSRISIPFSPRASLSLRIAVKHIKNMGALPLVVSGAKETETDARRTHRLEREVSKWQNALSRTLAMMALIAAVFLNVWPGQGPDCSGQ